MGESAARDMARFCAVLGVRRSCMFKPRPPGVSESPPSVSALASASVSGKCEEAVCVESGALVAGKSIVPSTSSLHASERAAALAAPVSWSTLLVAGAWPITVCSREVAPRSSCGFFALSIASRASSPCCACSSRGKPPSVTGKSISWASEDCGFVRSRLLILAASKWVGAPGGCWMGPALGPPMPGTGGMPRGKDVGSLPSTSVCAIF
mmetsp:Transcript_56031/g.128646  ORF Transcript_56031/g.128646 Transcript_56031/m.128646 type:complete len:209 (-) Transcript_56031:518-1144(-)